MRDYKLFAVNCFNSALTGLHSSLRRRSAFDFSGPHVQVLYRFGCMESRVPVVSPRLDGAFLHEYGLRWLRVERRRLLNRQD